MHERGKGHDESTSDKNMCERQKLRGKIGGLSWFKLGFDGGGDIVVLLDDYTLLSRRSCLA
jgi:hypothetical protein